MNDMNTSAERTAYLLANPSELARFVDMAEKNADDWLALNRQYTDQTALIQSQAAEIERMRTGLADLKWRVDDIRDRLLGGGTGHSVYGIDEWSEPAVNLKLAGKKIDAILATTQPKG